MFFNAREFKRELFKDIFVKASSTLGKSIVKGSNPVIC